MKTWIKSLSILTSTAASISLSIVNRSDAQALRTLHNFVPSGGRSPLGELVLSSNTLYGTTFSGGISNYGTVFRISTNGSDFTILHNFTGGGDGSGPHSGMVISNDTLYGTTTGGTVFRFHTDGTEYSVLHKFAGLNTPTNIGGASPMGPVLLSGNILYGTTSAGGSSGFGTVFKINTDGAAFTTLYNFSAGDGFTNTDGALPFGGLILSGNTLYGTTFLGGNWGSGTVFAVNTDGTGIRALYSFAPEGPLQFDSWPNVGGGNPRAGLVLSGGILYGTAGNGGTWGGGTLFKVDIDSTAFAVLHDFSGDPCDGFHPYSGMALSGSVLYGTTVGGGSGSTLFAINTDGSGFAVLSTLNIGGGSDPEAAPIVAGNTLYGVTAQGGNSSGTIYSLLIRPQLMISPSGQNIIVAWPTNSTGFTLQTATNLALPVVWSTVTPTPVVINGQNTVTNPIAGTQQFYRLSQ